MRVNWTDPKTSRFQKGDFFVGKSLDGLHEVGVRSDRHALTDAGARSGKGVATIIPNLQRWPDSTLVIDPKGEAAEATAEDREEKFKMPSYVLDPFHVAQIPDRLRASFNLLDSIDPTSPLARTAIEGLAESLLMRHDPHAGHWDGGAKDVLAGLLAFVIAEAPPEYRDLIAVRDKLLDLENGGSEAQELLDRLRACDAFGGLAQDAAGAASTEGEGKHFISAAARNTKWLKDPSIAATISTSSFNLSDLKEGQCSVYLVVPPTDLAEHGRFLRLFVMAALKAMGTKNNGRRCLFLLDEFFSLGHIPAISTAAGLMPGMGIHLWPIIQNLSQLTDLYGRDGAETVIGNADLIQFFGNTDQASVDLISNMLGKIDISQYEAPPEKPQIRELDYIFDYLVIKGVSFVASEVFHTFANDGDRPKPGQLTPAQKASRNSDWIAKEVLDREMQKAHLDHQNEMVAYQHQMRDVGKPRMSPDEVRLTVRKPDNEPIAQRQVAFIKNRPFLLALNPYFNPRYRPALPVRSEELPPRPITTRPVAQPVLGITQKQWDRIDELFPIVIGVVSAVFMFGVWVTGNWPF